ncbi:hypothetical protein F5Y15DRAFT_66190 [Xylariaceae sp. FL0016]|nr:hypothetical protein F5Y15DRAFT_66190 [Xylariaceae sp. FL0016]
MLLSPRSAPLLAHSGICCDAGELAGPCPSHHRHCSIMPLPQTWSQFFRCGPRSLNNTNARAVDCYEVNNLGPEESDAGCLDSLRTRDKHTQNFLTGPSLDPFQRLNCFLGSSPLPTQVFTVYPLVFARRTLLPVPSICSGLLYIDASQPCLLLQQECTVI